MNCLTLLGMGHRLVLIKSRFGEPSKTLMEHQENPPEAIAGEDTGGPASATSERGGDLSDTSSSGSKVATEPGAPASTDALPSEASPTDGESEIRRSAETRESSESKKKKPKKLPKNPQSNNVRKLRIERMMSKAELARRANLSVLTVDRVEKGFGSRMNTKRKILEALGLSLADRVRVFGEEE